MISVFSVKPKLCVVQVAERTAASRHAKVASGPVCWTARADGGQARTLAEQPGRTAVPLLHCPGKPLLSAHLRPQPQDSQHLSVQEDRGLLRGANQPPAQGLRCALQVAYMCLQQRGTVSRVAVDCSGRAACLLHSAVPALQSCSTSSESLLHSCVPAYVGDWHELTTEPARHV